MITLGLDPHPGSHTVVALDCNGCLLANITVPNTVAGLGQLHLFAGQFGSPRWAIEGAVITSLRRSSPSCLSKKKRSIRSHRVSPVNIVRGEGGRKTTLWMPPMWLRALLANPQLPAQKSMEQQRELQEMSRAQRHLSEQLRSNRSALAELTEHSPVRQIIEQVIGTLVSNSKG